MARKRFVTTDISINPKVADVADEDPVAALMWPWFCTNLDDWARAEAHPTKIRLNVFQAFGYKAGYLDEVLRLYEKHRLLHLYEVDGKRYMQADPDTFYDLQTYIQEKRRSHDSSSFPPPPEHPWGKHWPTSDWHSISNDQQTSATIADKVHQPPKIVPSPSPSPSPSPTKNKAKNDDDEEGAAVSRWEKLPDEKRDEWNKAFEFVFVKDVSPAWYGMVTRFKNIAGMSDRLIVKAMEIAHAGADGSLLAYTEEILSRWAAEEITTVEQYEASQAARVAAKEQRAQERATANVRPIRGKQQPTRSNVFLDRESPGKKDDAYYDHIYRRFDERPVAN